MADDERPPGRPPDSPHLAQLQSQDLFPHAPILTAPLSQFETMEVEVASQKRKLSVNNFNNDSTNVTDENASTAKRDRVTAPSLISRTKYSHLDRQPFLVYASLFESDPASGTTLHPIKFGQLLQKLNIVNIVDGGIKRIGRNRVSVEFKGPEDANAFIDNDSIKQKGFTLMIPTFNITRMGVVRGVPSDWSKIEDLDALKSPLGKVLKVRRLNRRVTNDGKSEWIATSSVVITFDGQSLPDRVFCCFNSLPVEIYNFPTVQCFGCCKYGHTRTQCRSKPRCYRCGGDHFGDGCTSEEPKCFYCTGAHPANSRQCPEYLRQRNIKSTMAKDNISYSEAAKCHAPSYRSFADVAASASPALTIHQTLNHDLRPPRLPIPNYTSHSQPSTSSPSKKIFTTRPKPHTAPHPGYDRRAHQDIINSYSFPSSPNGCALMDHPPTHNDNEETINTIITLLSTLFSNHSLPDHVADNIVNKIKNRNIPSHAVEHQKRTPQKT